MQLPPSESSARLRSLERRVSRLRNGLAVVIAALGIALLGSGQEPEAEVLRARGLVLVDEAGRERVLLGAPVPESRQRRSPLREVGLVVLDADGQDRLFLGESNGLVRDGEVLARERAFSLLIHDRAGDERGGFGTFDSGKAVCVLDRGRPDSDGVALMVDDSLDYAGLLVNHRQQEGRYVQAVSLGVQHGNVALSFDDVVGRRRLKLELPASGDPALRLVSPDGGAVRDALAER